MGSDKSELSRIVGAVSRQAGAVVGTSVANTKKITSFGVKGVAAVKDLVARPVRRSAEVTDKKNRPTSKKNRPTSKKNRPTSKASALKPRAEGTIAKAKADAKETIAKLKSEARAKEKSYNETTAKLKTEVEEKSKARTEQIAKIRAKSNGSIAKAKAEVKADAKETIAKLKSEARAKEKSYNETIAKLKREAEEKSKAHTEQIAKIRAKSNGAIANAKTKAKAKAVQMAAKVKVDAEETIAKYAKSQLSSGVSAVRTETEAVLSNPREEKAAVAVIEDVNVGIEKRGFWSTLEAEAPNPPDMVLEEVHAAVFPNAAEQIILARALSDITSRDVAARIDGAKAMACIRHELSVKGLAAQMAWEPLPQVRQECIKALTTLGIKKGLPAVERALTDQAASVRLAAVRGLYHLAGAESAPALIRMFSDENEEIRRRAATCIGWLGKTELAVELLPLLADSSVSVRRAAVEAMSNLRSRRVVSVLIEHLNDPEKVVRKAVLNALQTITGKKMSGPSPKDEESFQRLIARWREWWKEELLG